MSIEHPDRITIEKKAQLEVSPKYAVMNVIIEGDSAFFGNEVFAKSKEVKKFLADIEAINFAVDNISLQNVSIQTNTGKLLTSSSASFALKLDKIELVKVPELLNVAANQKNISIQNVSYCFGDLKEEKTHLMKEACVEAKHSGLEISAALNVPLLGIYSIVPRWIYPAEDNEVYPSAQGMMKSRSITSRRVEGLDIVANRKEFLKLQLTVEFRVGAFQV